MQRPLQQEEPCEPGGVDCHAPAREQIVTTLRARVHGDVRNQLIAAPTGQLARVPLPPSLEPAQVRGQAVAEHGRWRGHQFELRALEGLKERAGQLRGHNAPQCELQGRAQARRRPQQAGQRDLLDKTPHLLKRPAPPSNGLVQASGLILEVADEVCELSSGAGVRGADCP
eukprot:9925275-Alexandrium_andersonii.AAC.1